MADSVTQQACCGGDETHQVTTWKTSAHATVHCMIGCVIGEVLGLVIGVSLGLPVWQTITLAVVLAFVVGVSLAVYPVMSQQGLTLSGALGVVWLGEVVSISVMEFAMNAVDLALGGVQSGSIFNSTFWIALLFAIPAGFLAAWPANYWLLSRKLKSCH